MWRALVAEVPVLKRLASRWFYRLINSISDTPINESAADIVWVGLTKLLGGY